MKISYKLIIAILLTAPLSMASYAAEPQKPAEPMPMPGMGMQHKGMDMMGGMTEAEQEQHLQAQQEYMLKMHDLSNQILAEKDSAKKEQLKKQQLELMKAHRAKMMEVHHPMK
ncbi:MAG: hypothetical protein ACXWTS_04480 [Methylococcaceae bacterium]